MATTILSKSPTFLGNFCKGIKIFPFSSEIIFGQLLFHIRRLFTGHTGHNLAVYIFRVSRDESAEDSARPPRARRLRKRAGVRQSGIPVSLLAPGREPWSSGYGRRLMF